MKLKLKNEEGKVNKNVLVVIAQIGFLVLVLGGLYMLYPKSNVSVNGDFVKFDSINANVILISENPDFTNPRYVDLSLNKNTSFSLAPGTYYWKPDNGIISGFTGRFTIDSKVGLVVNRSENETDLVNVGNVKINVTKDKNGALVGHVILSPEQAEKIEESGKYTGRQE